jgi:microcystin-dependent protein
MPPYIGQLDCVGFSFAPVGWLPCDGRLLPISQYDPLFTLIGTTYGGDGQQTFALPDLRGRAPIHAGAGSGLSNYVIGQQSGVESVTLTGPQTPVHSHAWTVTSAAGNQAHANNTIYGTSVSNPYHTPPANVPLAANMCPPFGGNSSHENRPPFLAINWIICVEGVFPPRG